MGGAEVSVGSAVGGVEVTSEGTTVVDNDGHISGMDPLLHLSLWQQVLISVSIS